MGQVKGTAEGALGIRETQDVMGSCRSETVLLLLGEGHAKLTREKFDEAYGNCDSARRRHGQSMNDWIVHLRRAKFDMEVVGKHAAIPDRMMACASLPPKERSQVWFN